LSYSSKIMINKKNILDIGITNATNKEILEYIVKNLENFKKKLYFVTPNPEFLVLANKNNTFKEILNKADLALVDGVGILIAAKILGKPLKGRFTGVDLVKSLCKEVAEKPITVGFLGGRGGVAEETAECLRKKYPKLKVAFAGEEWMDEDFSARQPRVSDDTRMQNFKNQSLGSSSLSKIRHQTEKLQPNFNSSESGLSHQNLTIKKSFREGFRGLGFYPSYTPSTMHHLPVDILFVAFGCPKQEFWISENLDKIPVKIAIGVGGAFDYLSGKIPRAPGFVRAIGFEWLFRLVVQPWRWKRQISLLEFIWLVIEEKIK
jgi:UDP-N-acetyl-D-mannosaminuronic acid transferase (WecB/TagA/CpsF family)